MKRSLDHAFGLLAALLSLGLFAAPAPARAADADEAERTRYLRVNVKGRLADTKDTPIVGATVRFLSTAEDGKSYEATTGPDGSFVVEKMPYGTYAIELLTAEGEQIFGVNPLPISEGKPVTVQMRVSERLKGSRTSLENVPSRFLITTETVAKDWSRFWRELAIFIGASIGLGAAAL